MEPYESKLMRECIGLPEVVSRGKQFLHAGFINFEAIPRPVAETAPEFLTEEATPIIQPHMNDSHDF